MTADTRVLVFRIRCRSRNRASGRSMGRLGYLCVVASECRTQLVKCLCDGDFFIMAIICVCN